MCVYSRPIKPVREMTETKIDLLATAMYEQMTGLVKAEKNLTKVSLTEHESGSEKYF